MTSFKSRVILRRGVSLRWDVLALVKTPWYPVCYLRCNMNMYEYFDVFALVINLFIYFSSNVKQVLASNLNHTRVRFWNQPVLASYEESWSWPMWGLNPRCQSYEADTLSIRPPLPLNVCFKWHYCFFYFLWNIHDILVPIWVFFLKRKQCRVCIEK